MIWPNTCSRWGATRDDVTAIVDFHTWQREVIMLAGLALVLLICPGQATTVLAAKASGAVSGTVSGAENEILEKARRKHQSALTIDTHVDIAGADYATERLDPGVDKAWRAAR
jgi:hypothetical protein